MREETEFSLTARTLQNSSLPQRQQERAFTPSFNQPVAGVPTSLLESEWERERGKKKIKISICREEALSGGRAAADNTHTAASVPSRGWRGWAGAYAAAARVPLRSTSSANERASEDRRRPATNNNKKKNARAASCTYCWVFRYIRACAHPLLA